MRARALTDAVRMADAFRIDLAHVWPHGADRTITTADVLTYAVFGMPDRLKLAAVCDLPGDAPVDEIQAVLDEYVTTLGGSADA